MMANPRRYAGILQRLGFSAGRAMSKHKRGGLDHTPLAFPGARDPGKIGSRNAG